jgi:hypothetical protein
MHIQGALICSQVKWLAGIEQIIVFSQGFITHPFISIMIKVRPPKQFKSECVMEFHDDSRWSHFHSKCQA